MPLVPQQGQGAHCRALPVSFLCHSTSALDISADDNSSLDSSDYNSTSFEVAVNLPPLRHCFTDSLPSPVSPDDMQPHQHQHYSLAPHRSEEQPIEEREWVQIFSEILRQARENGQQVKPASQVLYDYIKNTGITPLWEDITLPGGRSLRSHQFAFEQFQNRGPEGLYPLNPMKRPLERDPTTATGRPLAPKPMPIPTPTGPTAPQRTFGPAQPTPMSPRGQQLHSQPPKKRGRPSKKEQEARRQRQSEANTAIAQSSQTMGLMGTQAGPSSEVPQSPTTSARTQQRGADVSTPQAQTQPGSQTNSSSSGKKRRGRPPKNQDPTGPPPPFPPLREAVDTPQSSSRQESRRSGSPSKPVQRRASDEAPEGRPTRHGHAEAPEEGRQAPHWTDTLLNDNEQ